SWHRHDCPPALEGLILRLLEKDPTKRPESAAVVRQALQSLAPSTEIASLARPSRTSGRTDTTLPADGQTPVPLSLAKGEGEGEGRPPASEPPTGNPMYRTTFVGRGAEVKILQSALDAALSANGGLVMVAGEPGIGKTALCEQLVTYANLRGAK